VGCTSVEGRSCGKKEDRAILQEGKDRPGNDSATEGDGMRGKENKE